MIRDEIDKAWDRHRSIITANDLIFNKLYMRKYEFEKAVRELIGDKDVEIAWLKEQYRKLKTLHLRYTELH